jgi:diguanylate cyclase (GGDEF)-like protein
MPVSALHARESESPGAEATSLDRSALDPRPLLHCQADDAIATARRLFESWLRGCVRSSFGRQSASSDEPVPRTAILRIVEKAQAPGSLNSETRRLIRLLADRLKGLDALLRKASMLGDPSPEFGGAVLEAGLSILAVFAGLEAERAALHAAADPLTGLGGRRVMEERLHQERSRTSREGRHCSIAMLDVDHFKRVNDSHGHATGDRVLVGFAGILQESLRSYDGVYRYGGEEFVLCLPGVTATVAHRMVERIRKTLSTTPFETSAGRTFFVSFSAGIAAIEPGLEPAQSIDLADGALYRAKSAGRNRVFLSDSTAAA